MTGDVVVVSGTVESTPNVTSALTPWYSWTSLMLPTRTPASRTSSPGFRFTASTNTARYDVVWRLSRFAIVAASNPVASRVSTVNSAIFTADLVVLMRDSPWRRDPSGRTASWRGQG